MTSEVRKISRGAAELGNIWIWIQSILSALTICFWKVMSRSSSPGSRWRCRRWRRRTPTRERWSTSPHPSETPSAAGPWTGPPEHTHTHLINIPSCNSQQLPDGVHVDLMHNCSVHKWRYFTATFTSSAVQKDASAFLYICQMSWYWMGKMTKRRGLSFSSGSSSSVMLFFTAPGWTIEHQSINNKLRAKWQKIYSCDWRWRGHVLVSFTVKLKSNMWSHLKGRVQFCSHLKQQRTTRTQCFLRKGVWRWSSIYNFT